MLAGVLGLADLEPVVVSTSGQGFGARVDVSGDFAIVANDNLRKENPNPVYVYQRDDKGNLDPADDTWSEFAQLDAAGNDDFGQDVEIEGDLIVIGAENTVFTYAFDGTSWNLETPLATPEPELSNTFGGGFGQTIELFESTLVVSELRDTSGSDGKVFVFERDTDGWELAQTFVSATAGAETSSFGADLGLYEDTLVVVENSFTESHTRNAHIYHRDGSGMFKLEESLTDLDTFAVAEAGAGNQVVIANRVAGFGGENLQFYSRSDTGDWTNYQNINDAVGGYPEFDGSVLLTRPGSPNQDATVLYELDSVTGLWQQRDVDFRRVDVSARDQFAAIDDGTIVRGYLSDDVTATNSGSVDFLYYDSASTTLTVTTSQISPSASVEVGPLEGDGYGSTVALGRDFAAVTAVHGNGFFESVISIFSIDDGGTPLDLSDDTNNYAYSLEAIDETSGARIQSIVARENQLLVASRDALLVYDIGETSATLVQSLQFALGTASGNDAFEIDGDRAYVHTDMGSQDHVEVFEFNGTQWVAHSTLAVADRTRGISVDGDLLVTVGFSSTSANLYKYENGAWSLTESLASVDPALIRNPLAVSIEDDLIVFGDSFRSTTYRFDGASWLMFDDLVFAGTALELVDGALVAFSGQSTTDVTNNRIYVYELDGDAWKSTSTEFIQTSSFARDIASDGDRFIVGATSTNSESLGNAFTFYVGNQSPVARNTTVRFDENTSDGAVSENRLFTFDPDFNDELTYSIVSGDTGAFTINNDGFLVVADSTQLDFETTTRFEFDYQVSDGDLSATATVRVFLQDVFEAEISGDFAGSLTEDDSSVSGLLSYDGANSFVALTESGQYGSFKLTADGSWTYTPSSAAQALPEGVIVQDSFSIATTDGGESATVVIDVTGVNDVPTFTGDLTGVVNEDDTDIIVSRRIFVNDPDEGESGWNVINETGSRLNFSLTEDGFWDFQLNDVPFWQMISEGTVGSANPVLTSLDGTSFQLVVSVIGENDAAVITGDDSGTTDEDATVPVTGKLIVDDIDRTIFERGLQVATIAGAYGTLTTVRDGDWSYSVDNAAVQNLAAGQTVEDVIVVSSIDGTTKEITITITGNNDVSVVGGDLNGNILEDSNLEDSGVATISDVDDGTTFIAETIAGTYGSLTIAADGNWTYTVDTDAIQFLNDDESELDEFTIVTTDASSAVVSVLIEGVTDVTPVPDATPGFEIVQVNNYDPSSDTGGFEVTYEFTVSEDVIIGDDLFAWGIQSGYSGAGEITNVYLRGFNGPTSQQTGSFDITNVNESFRPELKVGDSFEVSFQVANASFNSADFSPTFLDLDPEPVETDPSDVVISAGQTNDWGSGFTQSVKIDNVGQDTVQNWSLILDVPEGDTFDLTNVWGATAKTLDNGDILFTGLDWNEDISADGSINFGFQGDNSTLDEVMIEGFDFTFI